VSTPSATSATGNDSARTSRGDGVGIEFTTTIVRGVALERDEPGRVRAAAEVGIRTRDDRGVLDALVRLRAELGGTRAPTRVALFPPGSTLHRIDVTGRTGPELNGLRSTLERVHAISSTVLIDDGPRRWMMAVRWDEAVVRRLEELVERAGFVDVAIDPSPVAISRVVDPNTTVLRRDAATDESFDVVLRGLPIVACAVDSIGRQPPDLLVADDPVSGTAFDELVDPVDIVTSVERAIDTRLTGTSAAATAAKVLLHLADDGYPPYPIHDIRSPERQCVALGAAVGAAGLSGRIRPIDMMIPAVPAADTVERPWAIERMSTLPPKSVPRPVTPTKRLVGRVLPRRRR
jgi:hypothetical protein